MRPTRAVIAGVALLAALASTRAGHAAARNSAPLWEWRSTKVRGVTISYAIAVPPGSQKGQKRNVLLAFPPGGQTKDLVDVGLRRYWAAEGTKRGWIVISPAAPRTGLFMSGSSKLISPFLDAAIAKSGFLADDVALGGISNGGLSAFRAALDHPARYSALVTLPGVPPAGTDAAQLTTLARMRVGLWVGGNDLSWRSSSQRVFDTLAGLSSIQAKVSLDVLDGQGHILEGVKASDVWDVIEGKTT